MAPQSRSTTAISLFILASLPAINAFGTIGGNYRVGSRLVTPSTLPKSTTSPLFVANASRTNDDDSPFIKSIEAKMEKAQKQRQAYQEKLSSFDDKMQTVSSFRYYNKKCPSKMCLFRFTGQE